MIVTNLLIRICIIIYFLVSLAAATTYYVDAANGHDDSSGIESQPWKTIQKAAKTLVAGDTVYIKAGTYKERVTVQISGIGNSYIVFSNYQNDLVTVDGTGITWGEEWNGLFDISNRAYIIVDGIIVSNAETYGAIWIEESNHITIKNCKSYNSYSSGISCWNSQHITIDSCEVELACNNGEQESISVENSSDIIVSHSEVHHNGSGENGGEGIDIKNGSHDVKVFGNVVHHLNERIGLYADAWDSHTYNIEFSQNIVYNCGNNGLVVQSEMGGLIENVTIMNNIIYKNKWDGIAIGSVAASDTVSKTPVKNIKIINNTVYQNGIFQGGWGYGILVNNPDAEGVVIRNNICSENSAQIGIEKIKSGGVVDHNLIDGENQTKDAVFGSDSVVAKALFVDTASFDFRLKENSLAINTGSSVDAPDIDFNNTPRPLQDKFDIGAFEFDPSASVVPNSIHTKRLGFKTDSHRGTTILYFTTQKNSFYTLKLYTLSGKLINKVQGFVCDEIEINHSAVGKGIYLFTVSILLSPNNIIGKIIVD